MIFNNKVLSKLGLCVGVLVLMGSSIPLNVQASELKYPGTGVTDVNMCEYLRRLL